MIAAQTVKLRVRMRNQIAFLEIPTILENPMNPIGAFAEQTVKLLELALLFMSFSPPSKRQVVGSNPAGRTNIPTPLTFKFQLFRIFGHLLCLSHVGF